MSFKCKQCGKDHSAARLLAARVQTVGGRPLSPLPLSTLGEFLGAYPDANLIIDERTTPVTWQFFAAGSVPTQVVAGITRDEFLHPDDYPFHREGAIWVTVGGAVDTSKPALEYERGLDTPLGRLFKHGSAALNIDPIVLDFILRPVDAKKADEVRDAVANARHAERLVREAQKTPAPEDDQEAAAALAEATRVLNVAMSQPFPIFDGTTYRFSDGTQRTAQSFAEEANRAARARIGI